MCRLELIQPILRPAQLEALKHMKFRGWSTKVLDATWPIGEGAAGMQDALQRICSEATAAIEDGYEFIVLSDRNQGEPAATELPAPVHRSAQGSCQRLLHPWAL